MIYADYADLTTEALEKKLERAQKDKWRAFDPLREAKLSYEQALKTFESLEKVVDGIEGELRARQCA